MGQVLHPRQRPGRRPQHRFHCLFRLAFVLRPAKPFGGRCYPAEPFNGQTAVHARRRGGGEFSGAGRCPGAHQHRKKQQGAENLVGGYTGQGDYRPVSGYKRDDAQCLSVRFGHPAPFTNAKRPPHPVVRRGAGDGGRPGNLPETGDFHARQAQTRQPLPDYRERGKPPFHDVRAGRGG